MKSWKLNESRDAAVRLSLVLAVGIHAGLCASADGLDALRARLAGSIPVGDYMQARTNPYLMLKGVERIGRTPVRNSKDVASSPLGIGFETLDRDTFDPAPYYKLLGQTGVKWARCGTGWKKCEVAPGTFDFVWLDKVVDGLLAEGIQPWFQLGWGHPDYTPCKKFAAEYARAQAGGPKVTSWGRGYVGEAPYYWGDRAMQGWSCFVRELARHYKGRVKVYQVWNEPEWFWRYDGNVAVDLYGTTKAAADFASFVERTGRSVRESDPDARIGFNLACLSSGWLPALSKAGIGDVVDIYMYHGYQPYPEAAIDSVYGQMRALLKRKDGSLPEIWQGESGRATDKANNGIILPTQYSQARFIARRITTDVSLGAKVTSIFTCADFLNYYDDGRDQYYGLIDGRSLKPKHGYYTFQFFGWLLDGLVPAPENAVYFTTHRDKEFVDTLPYAAVRTASFKRNGVPVFAFWLPQHVELNAVPVDGALKFVTAAEAGTFGKPVLIDPVRCEVYDVSSLVRTSSCSGEEARDWRRGIDLMSPAIALDYPLFLTDAKIFD